MSFLVLRDATIRLLGPCVITAPVAGHQAGTMSHRPHFVNTRDSSLIMYLVKVEDIYGSFVEKMGDLVFLSVTRLLHLVVRSISAVPPYQLPLVLCATKAQLSKINDCG